MEIRPRARPTIARVAENLYSVIRRSYFTCSYILVLPEGVFLIDAGMDSSGEDMLDALSSIGKGVEEVKAILLTHWHNDHSAGACEIQRLSGARVYYHEKEAIYFTRKTASVGLQAKLSEMVPESGPLILIKGLLASAPARAVKATQYVNHNNLIEGQFRVIETPGHTPGHVCYYHEPQRILFAGDALAAIGGRVRYMARLVTPDIDSARESMLRCLELPVDYLCPGHREPVISNVQEECDALKKRIKTGERWPLLG
jgi:glyoxylase-like metal-dependent hydrolase (beta-lactamase superfamily II)